MINLLAVLLSLGSCICAVLILNAKDEEVATKYLLKDRCSTQDTTY